MEDKQKEQDIRIEARGWWQEGCSENQAENIALHFFEKGWDEHGKAMEEKADYTMKNLIRVKKLDAEGLVLLVKKSQEAFEEGYQKGQQDLKDKSLCKCGHEKASHIGGFIKGDKKGCCIKNWETSKRCKCQRFESSLIIGKEQSNG